MTNKDNPKSVLVTAGATGIGRAIAEGFSESGAAVHVIDIDESALHGLPQQYLHTVVDVSDEEGVVAAVREHVDVFGSIDVLVNCAGIQGPTSGIEDISIQDWRRCMAVNLDAMYISCREVVPHMKRQGRGNIINIASTAGWHGYPLRAPYASSKWGVIGLTKSLAMELGIHGIRCNVICPGSVEGSRMDRVIASEAVEKGVSEAEIRQGYTSGSSLRTFVAASDVADMAIFLASDAARKVTGQIMNVDGHLESFGGLNHGGASPPDRV